MVYAHRPEAARHDEYLAWLDRSRVGSEPLGLAGAVLSGFLRVVTNPRIFVDPTPPAVAVEFADRVMASPAALRVEPSDRHWSILSHLVSSTEAKGNAIPDAYLAALVIEHGGVWITADRGFARFPGLRWRHPLDE